MGLLASPDLGWLQDRTFIYSSFTYPLFNHLSGGFDKIFKQKQVLQMMLLIAQCV
jgi:hypothetical protein